MEGLRLGCGGLRVWGFPDFRDLDSVGIFGFETKGLGLGLRLLGCLNTRVEGQRAFTAAQSHSEALSMHHRN